MYWPAPGWPSGGGPEYGVDVRTRSSARDDLKAWTGLGCGEGLKLLSGDGSGSATRRSG